MATIDDGRRDFDFELGRWNVHNRRLLTRLQGCTEWQEFASFTDVIPLLGGLGNLERWSSPAFADGKPFEAFALRIFQPATRLWSIHWADDRRCALDPPVVGRFEDGHGQFFCDDVLDGRPIRVRFDWKDITPTSARWEQAFSPDGGKTWETNWTMDFTRTA